MSGHHLKDVKCTTYRGHATIDTCEILRFEADHDAVNLEVFVGCADSEVGILAGFEEARTRISSCLCRPPL